MIGRLLSVGCSWCHAVVATDDPAWPTCPECGHRADRPRMFCDCHACQTGASVRIFPLDLVDALVRLDLRTIPADLSEHLRSWGLDPADYGIEVADDPPAVGGDEGRT